MHTAIVLAAILLAGCSTFEGRVASMQEQAELCDGTVQFSVMQRGGVEIIKYKCEWNYDEPI